MKKKKTAKAPKPVKPTLSDKLLQKAIKGAAKTYKVEPYELNKVQFWAEVSKLGLPIKEWDLRKLGGYEAVRNQLFPTPEDAKKPENPLANEAANRLSGHELSGYIAGEMKEAAEAMGIAPHEMTWAEFRQYIQFQWGTNNAGIAKYNITRAGGFNQIRDAYFAIHPSPNTVDKHRMLEHTNLNRALGKAYAKKQFFLESAEEFAKRCFEGKVKPCPIPVGDKKTDRVVNVILSDLHIGSDITAEETGYQTFGRVEESRRLAALTKQICSYKYQYRATTKLVIHLIGDIIQGQLHDARDGAVQAEQFGRAVHLLCQVIAQCATAYKEVEIHCATGNHGRNTARHLNRAVHQKWDSIETEIYLALFYACSNLKNVKIVIPKTPYCKIEVLEHKFFSTHGDTVLKPGYPGSAINTKSLAHQIDKINSSLPDHAEYSVFLVGHVHTPSMTFLDNGTVMITNGCLVPVDQFAVSIGIMESQCGQWIWESVKGHPVGDARLIKVGKEHDADESLDAIIKPWTGLPS